MQKIGKVKVSFTLESNGMLQCTVAVTILWLAKNLDSSGSLFITNVSRSTLQSTRTDIQWLLFSFLFPRIKRPELEAEEHLHQKEKS
jgi:hypothetical protein